MIVESPAKAKTLARFLGDAYRIEASFGHVRDLPEKASEVPAEIRKKPWGRLGVDVDGDFTPYYVIPADKKKQVAALKAALKDASELFLATDPDREGESISWHLREILKPKVPVRRIVFHEITEEAVREALAYAHDLDENLVRAQESRRILDRLYGYTLSPVLWKKVPDRPERGTRAERGRPPDRRARGSAPGVPLERVTGTSKPGCRAKGASSPRRWCASATNAWRRARTSTRRRALLANPNVRHLDEAAARGLADGLERHLPWTVTSVEARPGVERPAPPFTTSTLTQEASRKLGFSTERTMQIAQRLFQGVEIGGGEIEGLITYHRTDSTTLSEKALGESARVIREMFGAEYYTGPRRYQTRVKNAQEAHEAIRPDRLPPDAADAAAYLDADELRVYELVWKRTMASQMPDARVLKTSVEITGQGPAGEPCVFTATRQGHRVRRVPARLRRRQRRPGRRTGRPGIDPAGDEAGRSRRVRRAARARPRVALAGLDAEGARDAAAGALHRGGAHQGTRSRRASAGRPPTRRPSPPSSAAATCSGRARRWCRASRPSR